MKQKAVAISIMLLMGVALLFTSVYGPQVSGQSPYGLTIFYLTSQGGFEQLENATVGQPVTLLASLFTANGTYNLYFNDKLVDSGSAQGYFVSSNFTIPEVPAGDYNFTLTDVSANQNTTTPYFPILTAYSIQPIVPSAPSQLQEGDSVVLNVTVTGGDASTSYGAEVTVILPSGVSNFTKTITLTTSSLGTAQASVTYPDSSFSPTGSSTLYAGSYTVYFNQTQGLAQNSFAVGFTDFTTYHRGDVVKINAVGYQPNQVATVSIAFNNVPIYSETDTASSQGIITAIWTVPADAKIGSYAATISPQTSPSKAVTDIQTFNVPGFPVTFRTLNLAGEVVPQLTIEAVDQAANQTFSNVTYYDGVTMINLEKGDVTVDAYWNNVKVGEITPTITGSSSSNITCQLTDFKIKVQDKSGVAIPFTDLNLTYQYADRFGSTEDGNATGQTDLTGVFTLNSTLPGIVYKIDASKYEKVFNQTSVNAQSEPTYEVTILCPDESLNLKVVDYNSNVLSNVRITLIEQASGIFYSLTTDSNGAAQDQVTFGQYRVDVYTADNILLNETVVNVLSNTDGIIHCVLYNLNVKIRVVDYFGAPVNNVHVELSRPGMNSQSEITQSDGTVSFNNVIGGDMEIIAYPSGNQNSFIAQNQQITSPTTVTLNMNRYVLLMGSLVDTSLLATIVIVVIIILVLIVFEVLRRTGLRFIRK